MSEYERQNRDELAYEPTAQEVGSDYGTRGDKSPEEIEREIEQTRSRLSRDIDELGNKLRDFLLGNGYFYREPRIAVKG